ncbi:MAG: hypothetical protein VKJ24_09760 [Synechococcales bacterium]|nr:hypothetical protein [Synechococcales bacterium]
MQRWEIGSEFHWTNEWLAPYSQMHWFPKHYQLFSTGTAALLKLVEVLDRNNGKRLTLHLPSYYCMEVPSKLQKVYQIAWYHQLPNSPQPDFTTLNPAAGDLVLAVNLFGIQQPEPWLEWTQANPQVIYLEDHSHDPFSPWARYSTADYAIASLHKTLPLPDGGLLWSPHHLPLPISHEPASIGINQRLAAMCLKEAYLQGATVSKEQFRLMEQSSHKALEDMKRCHVSDFTANILEFLDIPKFRSQREANVRHFIALSKTLQDDVSMANSNWQLLFDHWGAGYIPFNSIVVCATPQIRDHLRQFLIESHIYPAIHWQHRPNISSGDAKAIDLSQRILTIPTDQRYSLADVERIVEKIRKFFETSSPSFVTLNRDSPQTVANFPSQPSPPPTTDAPTLSPIHS